MRRTPTATATLERRPSLSVWVLAMMHATESQQIEHRMLLRHARHRRRQLVRRLAVGG